MAIPIDMLSTGTGGPSPDYNVPWMQFDPAQRINSAISRSRQQTDEEVNQGHERGIEDEDEARKSQEFQQRSQAAAAQMLDMHGYQQDLAAGIPAAQAALKHPLAFSGRLPVAAFAPQKQPASTTSTSIAPPASNPFDMGNKQFAPPPQQSTNLSTGQPVLSPPKPQYDWMGQAQTPPTAVPLWKDETMNGIPGQRNTKTNQWTKKGGSPADPKLKELEQQVALTTRLALEKPSPDMTRAANAARFQLDAYRKGGASQQPDDALATPAPEAVPVTATNPKTGEKIKLVNGQWQPVQTQ